MAETILGWFMGLGKEWALIIISALPLVELRAAVPLGLGLGMPWYWVLLLCYIGNLLPIPLLLLFGARVLERMAEKGPFAKQVRRYNEKLKSKQQIIEKYAYLGLMLFVAIPAPGTGAWSGSIISTLLEMNRWKSFAAIAAGVVIAGLIMAVAMGGILGAARLFG